MKKIPWFRFVICGLIIWIISYFAFYYYYNPFVMGKHNMYIHPQGLYQIKYPANWGIEHLPKNKSTIIFVQKTYEPDDYRKVSEKWDYSDNSICITYYHDKKYYLNEHRGIFNNKCDEIILLNNQTVEVFYNNTGVADYGFALAELRIPCSSEGMVVCEIEREWYDKWIINPHAISPQRLLKKALPLLATLKLEKESQTQIRRNLDE